MTTVPSGQYRQSVSLSPKYRLALRLKNGKPHQSPSAQNRKIGSDCSFHASEPLENCSFSDRVGTRITLWQIVARPIFPSARGGLEPALRVLFSAIFQGVS